MLALDNHFTFAIIMYVATLYVSLYYTLLLNILYRFTCSIGTSDYTVQTGNLVISEDSLMQCVSIPIRSDSTTESEECFTFGVTARSTVTGLTVEPSETEICITDTYCEWTLITLATYIYIAS